jgi:hypothetical protein
MYPSKAANGKGKQKTAADEPILDGSDAESETKQQAAVVKVSVMIV